MPKRDDLSSIITSCDANVVLLSETWLHSDVDDSEIMPDHPHFNIYRHDRANRRGGGVLIAVDRRITSQKVLCRSALEIVWVSLSCCFGSFLIGACYRPPDASPEFSNLLRDELYMLSLSHTNKPIFLFGETP